MTDENYNGIAQDPRSDDKKALDYSHEELAGAITLPEVKWVDVKNKQLKSYIIQNQDGSSSCVAQATSKLLAIHEVMEGRDYTQLCPKFIYGLRSNYPDGGMWLPNALEIACKSGTCKESTIPCDNKGESFMNDRNIPKEAIDEAKQFRGKFYFEIKGRNIEDIASVLEQGYGVLLGFRFDYDEWTEVPFLNPNSQKKCGHGIAAVDYGIYQGKKALVIEDSWGPNYGKGGRRFITEEFLNARCFYAGYVTSLPNYVFKNMLRIGSKGLDVKMLQHRLNIKVDGIFGPQTEKAVKDFQIKNNIKIDGIVGPLTMSLLNK